MRTTQILEMTDRLYGSNQRVHLNTNWSKQSKDSFYQDDKENMSTINKPQSFQQLLATMEMKKRSLVQEIEKVRRDKQEALKEQAKWGARLKAFTTKCENIMGEITQMKGDGKCFRSDNSTPLADVLSESAISEAVQYLGRYRN